MHRQAVEFMGQSKLESSLLWSKVRHSYQTTQIKRFSTLVLIILSLTFTLAEGSDIPLKEISVGEIIVLIVTFLTKDREIHS
jgi:hypothetical protein